MPNQARNPCSGWGRRSGMRSHGGRRSDQACVGADALDRPTGVSPMAGRHVFRHRRVFVIAAHAHVRGDPLALEEDFDRLRGQPRVDFGAGEAMGNAVIMGGDLDVINDANAACPPFGELVRFGRKGFQRRAIDLFEQLPARHAEPPDRALFVQMRHQFADRRVDLRQAVKSSMAQPPEKPSLNDEHRLLDFCFGESRQMQMVWKRRHTQRSVSRTLFIPTTVASLN
jgi:hypothetical protein